MSDSHSRHEAIPLLDLKRANRPVDAELRAAFAAVLESGRFILGEMVEGFEREVASYLGDGQAVGMSSGTDALLASLMAVGIGPGDEVLCPAFSFFATAGSVWRLGARPVFADVSPRTFTSSAEDFERRLGEHTRALLPVHLFGRCAEMAPILDLGARHGVPVIEDAAQALGATQNGRKAGTFGSAACFSFFPTKNLGGFGDGGLVYVADDKLAERLRSLRDHGQSERYHHDLVGGNFRLDALQASLLRVKLPLLDTLNRQRRERASLYHDLLLASGLARVADDDSDSPAPVLLPEIVEGHVFHQYVVRLSGAGDRDALRRHLAASGIQTAVYYPVPLHLQPCFTGLGHASGDLPGAELLASQVLALPMFPEIRPEEQEGVAAAIAGFFAGQPPRDDPA